MICNNCGYELEDSMRFCVKCGMPTNTGEGNIEQNVQPTQNSSVIKSSINLKNGKMIIVISLVVLVILNLILGIFLLRNKSNDKDDNSIKRKKPTDLVELNLLDYVELEVAYTYESYVKIKLTDSRFEYLIYDKDGNSKIKYNVTGDIEPGGIVNIKLSDDFVESVKHNYGIVITETQKDFVIEPYAEYVKETSDISNEYVQEMKVFAEEVFNEKMAYVMEKKPNVFQVGETSYCGEILDDNINPKYYLLFKTPVTINDAENGVNTTIDLYHNIVIHDLKVDKSTDTYENAGISYGQFNTIEIDLGNWEKAKYYLPGFETLIGAAYPKEEEDVQVLNR